MSNLAVVHPDLEMKGGAESVCMHALEALQKDFDVTLFTLNSPDLEELNEYFDTKVTSLTVRTAGHLGPALNRITENKLVKLQSSVLGRFVDRHRSEFDLIFSTKNEFSFGTPAVQYVHSPRFRSADPQLNKQSLIGDAYDTGCRLLAGFDGKTLNSDVLLANSNWTANLLSRLYGVEAETVYPPVNVEQFPPRKWDDRANGFLTIGRIGPSKNILQNVEVVERLRKIGHDVHLHIVGPTTDSEYCHRVRRKAADLDFVTFDGPVERNRLIELITTHRYGLHGRPYEHFGIAVAEMVAGGMIPFAPNSGGQREILNENSTLLYDSVDEAVTSMDHILSNSQLQETLREELDSLATEFSRQRFKKDIRRIVRRCLR